jgi:hypothetical protein
VGSLTSNINQTIAVIATLKKPPGSSLVPLGSPQKVDDVARFVHGAMKGGCQKLQLGNKTAAAGV